MVAVISDGTSVLGLGDIGPKAAIPVMEGKALLLREFAGVDAFPICLDKRDEDEIVETAVRLAPVFGGINLEDISAPRCFVIEERLKNILDIPVFHDDQHGTAVVVYAGLLNALKLVNKELRNIKIVINGAGAAGIAVAKLLLNEGARNIICVIRWAPMPGRGIGMNQPRVGELYKPRRLKGRLGKAIRGDVFIGVSVTKVLTDEMVRSMNKDQ